MNLLELSFCKKWQKKSPNQETGLGNRGRLKVLNDTKLFLNEYELPPLIFKDQLGISQNLQTSPIY